MGDYKDKTVTI